VVTPDQVDRGVLRQRETGLRIGETLVEMGAVTEEDVGWALSRQLGFTFVDIDPEALDFALVRDFDETLLRRGDAVPLLRSEAAVSFAVADPTDQRLLDRLEAAAGVPLQLVIGTPSAIHRALDHVLGPRRAAPASEPGGDARHYDVVWERSGDTFLAFHVANALRRGARELHFLPGSGGRVRVLVREDGRLLEVATEPGRVVEALLARIEALGGPVLGEAAHVRGRLRCPVPQGDVLLIVSLLRTEAGPCVTLVAPLESSVPPALEDAGVDAGDAAELREALAGGAGLVLVGGPRGAGGSTLLAALAAAASAADGERRVLAFEGEATTALPGATRIALDPAAARAAWADIAVAQGADVVLLDDVLRGPAIDAVLGGAGARRLVLARTDWCDSAALLARLFDRPGGRATLAQRLLAVLQVRRVDATPPFLIETLVVSDPLRVAIAEGVAAPDLLVRAVAGGFRTLASRGAERVEDGTLEPRELRRARS
jgi:hypothetical protein